jgi:GMP synthase-like glutamine amidotransferase
VTVRAGLLVVGHVDPKSQHIAGDYPELFRALLEPVGLEVVPYALVDGQWPASLDECNVWVCSPSRNSVYDDLPWIGQLEDLVGDALAHETPFVGICFGHQLLAQAMGVEVRRSEGGWGVGVQEYDVVAAAPWMDPPLDRFRLIASHEDQVSAVPTGARLLATSAYCPVAGLAVGERAWSVQAHPEFVSPLADHLLAGRVELIGAERVAVARQTLDRALDRETLATWIARTAERG